MDTISLVRYGMTTSHELEDFTEILHSIDFKYNTRHLSLAGLRPEEINSAINKAMKVCLLNGIDAAEHFRSFYVFDGNRGSIYCDWRMTKQGFTLVVMNAPVLHMSIAHWQWEMVERISGMEHGILNIEVK